MASAQTTPQGGTGQPGPGAAPERSAPQPSPRGGQAQQGQDKEKGKAQQGAQGQGQEKGKAQQGAQGQGQDKGKAQQGAQGEDRMPAQRGQRERETTGQGAQGQRDQTQPQRGQRDQPQQGQRGQDAQPPRATEGQAGQGGSATLTAEQRTRVRETVITRGPRVTSVNFSVSVGTVVPRTVTVVEVPAVLVEIYPQYRGRKYFIYNDEIIIVDDGYRIVAVIHV